VAGGGAGPRKENRGKKQNKWFAGHKKNGQERKAPFRFGRRETDLEKGTSRDVLVGGGLFTGKMLHRQNVLLRRGGGIERKSKE